jgi:hypothetical protein
MVISPSCVSVVRYFYDTVPQRGMISDEDGVHTGSFCGFYPPPVHSRSPFACQGRIGPVTRPGCIRHHDRGRDAGRNPSYKHTTILPFAAPASIRHAAARPTARVCRKSALAAYRSGPRISPSRATNEANSHAIAAGDLLRWRPRPAGRKIHGMPDTHNLQWPSLSRYRSVHLRDVPSRQRDTSEPDRDHPDRHAKTHPSR